MAATGETSGAPEIEICHKLELSSTIACVGYAYEFEAAGPPGGLRR